MINKKNPLPMKYKIVAKVNIKGRFQKSNIIEALFEQTESLLGTDMELRELHKEGKISRIEVDLDIKNGKTIGEIMFASALNKFTTVIIASSLETIEKIGLSDAEIKILDISDVRGEKKRRLMERAKVLLAKISNRENGGGEDGED